MSNQEAQLFDPRSAAEAKREAMARVDENAELEWKVASQRPGRVQPRRIRSVLHGGAARYPETGRRPCANGDRFVPHPLGLRRRPLVSLSRE